MTAGIVRVRFSEGRFLRSADLTAEQDYRAGAARRHRIGGHSWGIVAGLRLRVSPGAFTVTPGLAVDGYGRTLFVTSPVEVPAEGAEGDRDVWLSLAPAGGRGGGAPSSCRPAATGEVTAICLAPVKGRTVDPRFPPGVPPGDLGYPPHSAVGAPPGPWPVYLGRVTWNGQNEPTVTDHHRAYAGLTGERLAGPSGRARLQIGARSSADPVRFAIATEQVATATDAEADPCGPEPPQPGLPQPGSSQPGSSQPGSSQPGSSQPGSSQPSQARAGSSQGGSSQPGPPPLTTQLVIDRTGALTGYGPTTLGGDLVIIPTGAPPTDAHTGITFAPTGQPVTAAPWTLYRTRIQRTGRCVDQLRIEIGHPGAGGDPTRNLFVVGTRGETDTPEEARFLPCFSVDAGCTVTVHQDLNVEGLLAERPVEVDRNDPRFAAEAVGGFVQGFFQSAAAIANRVVSERDAAQLAVTVQADPPDTAPVAGDPFRYTVAVTNSGSAAATSGQVYVVISVGDASEPSTRVLDRATFQPGTISTVPREFPVPPEAARQDLTISALAVAVGPAGNVISADGELAEEITIPPIL